MIIAIRKNSGVSKMSGLELVSNPRPKPSELKYLLDNTKAVYELRRFMLGTPYSMTDVWREVNRELLCEETGKEIT